MKILDFEAVIFDMDGTLIDSMGMWHDIDIEYLGRFGLDVPEDLQKCLEGLRYEEVAAYFKERFGISDSVEKIGQDWLDMAEYKYKYEVAFKPGVLEFLRFIREAGLKTAIASSNHMDLIEKILAARGLREDFDSLITCDDVKAGKPDPAVYLTAAASLGVAPEKCLVFEDIPVGILAGKRAGMTTIAVQDSYSAHMEEEKREMADGFISDYRELLG